MYQLQSYTLYMDLVDELSEGEIQFIECLSDDEQFSLISSVEKTPEKQTTSMTACSVETLPEITTPLYHSAAITQFQSLMLLLLFAIRNALSGKGITELLQLVRVHLPSSARMPSTVYSLRQFFIRAYPECNGQVHAYCSICHRTLQIGDGICEVAGCEGKSDYFICTQLPLQIKRMMEGTQLHLILWNSCYV